MVLAAPAASSAHPSGEAAPSGPVLAIHGGAGVVRGNLSPEEEASARAALAQALRAGHALLREGRPALDAVVAAVTVLEDDPAFNAGRGAVFTHEGHNELDASLMDGATRAAGAVAGVRRIRNPIQLARRVMEDSPHVMLVGEGAEAFAQSQGVALVDPAWFRTEKRWQQLQKARAEGAAAERAATVVADDPLRYFGTVGAVALDTRGALAAATSTGGMTDKRWGRVGDAPVIGAGTWADARCAVSGTGWGEFYIRSAAAHQICSRVGLLGEDIGRAATAVIDEEIPAMGGNGGAIALDAAGNIAMPFNTEGMYRGWIGADGVPHVAIGRDDAVAEDGAPAR
ncbi:asparaginase [Luteimonas sp. FCS-9]|nr:asparaginase [Luteimonas sp. FCS-9]